MTHELPENTLHSKLRAALGIDNHFAIDSLDAGFTSAEKYVVRDIENIPRSFIKVVQKNASDELDAMTSEVQNYRLLDELGLTGSVFPKVLDEIDTPDYKGLVLEYYDDVTWGGPWTDASIRSVHELLTRIHSTQLTDEQRRILQSTKDTLIPMQKIYNEALLSFQHKKTIRNSRGHIIFTAPDDRLFRALFEEEKTPDTTPPVLIAQDVNRYNICVDQDDVTHIVDPVYLNIGNPYQDLLNIAQDIIQTLPEGSPEIETTKQLFRPDDKHNPHVLNGIAYGLFAVGKPYEHSPAWMNYQQESLLTNVRLWYDQI